MDERGNISFVLIFFFIFIVVTMMFVVLAPAMQSYTSRVYLASEPLIEDANTTSTLFNDPVVTNQFQDTLGDQKDSYTLQLEILGTLNTYAWLFVVILTALIFLIYSRFLVERGVGVA